MNSLNGRILISDCQGRQQYNTQLLYFTCSSLGQGDERIYMISDQGGHPNVIVRDMFTGQEKTLTQNHNGILKSYVYFDGTQNLGRTYDRLYPCQCRWDTTLCPHDGRTLPGF